VTETAAAYLGNLDFEVSLCARDGIYWWRDARMAYSESCQRKVYRAIIHRFVKKKFTGGDEACYQKKTKKQLRRSFREKLKSVVRAQGEDVITCAEGFECFVEYDEDDDNGGWEYAGSGRWTETVTQGACTLKPRLFMAVKRKQSLAIAANLC
jgi:hypothetical protein